MRAWKTNKGIVAYLVLMVGIVMQCSAVLRADEPHKNVDEFQKQLELGPENDIPPIKALEENPSGPVPLKASGGGPAALPSPVKPVGENAASVLPGKPAAETVPNSAPVKPGSGSAPGAISGKQNPDASAHANAKVASESAAGGAGPSSLPPSKPPAKENVLAPRPGIMPPSLNTGIAQQPPPSAVKSDTLAPATRGPGLVPPSKIEHAPSDTNVVPGRKQPLLRTRDDAVPPGARGRGKPSNPNEEDIYKVVPQTCVPAKGQFVWNFEEEELISILRQVSDLLCRTIVVHDSIAKTMKMTIIGKSPLTPKDAWDVLMASLAAKGLALIEQGKTWTVIKRNETKSYSTPMYSSGKLAQNNEAIGTLFYKTRHASQDALKNVARALISKDGLVESIGDQFIIVIDSNSNIRRLGGIFAQVDVEDATNKVHILSMDNADAKTVEKQLRELFDVAAGGNPRDRRRRGGPTEAKSSVDIDKIIADERTNSLIVIADKLSVDKLREVVALIDQPASDQGSKGKIHVKTLRFADAKKIAETLTSVVQQGKGGSRYGRRRDEGVHELFEGDVKITAHENTNTLVTVASANDYRALLATINKLDVRKEQVYVEAVILDVQVTDDSDFGINLFGGIDPGLGSGALGIVANPGGRKMADGLKSTLTSGAAGSNLTGLGTNSIGALAVLGNFLSGGVAGIVGPSVPGTQIPSFGAVLQALSTNANVDVLSTPYLLTTDNQQAEMAVGEKIPVIRGASTVGSGGIGAGLGVPLQNIAHEDVKLTFKVTPHVGADDNVRLEIEQEVNEVGAEQEILGQKQFRIRTKSAKTTLVLKDQQTGVIGGLIHHKSSTTDTKVPFLGDIPILGWLFKNRNSKNDRHSLLLIITPYVIRTDEDYKKIVERKLKEREEFARLYYGGKIKNYNKYIDYDKKAGPMSSTLLAVSQEMSKVENGGQGDGGDVVIVPQENASDAQIKQGPAVNSEEQSSIDGGTAYRDDFSYEGDVGPEGEYPFEEFSSDESGSGDFIPSDASGDSGG